MRTAQRINWTLLDDYSRAYVYCDLLREPALNDTIRAMIAAMRQYQTIPKGVVFDNGPQFKGHLLSAFCSNLGIRLIHSSVYHPQTNGKLERAFRDDRREYYDLFDEWIFDELRRGLPEYVRYRNEIRGHYALGVKPSTTRLQEQDWFALPSVLDRLESYAQPPVLQLHHDGLVAAIPGGSHFAWRTTPGFTVVSSYSSTSVLTLMMSP